MLLFLFRAFQVVLVVKDLPANAGDVNDVSLIPGFGRTPGGGHLYRCLTSVPHTHETKLGQNLNILPKTSILIASQLWNEVQFNIYLLI